MLTTICAEPTLWDAILPEQCLSLPAGLAEIDELLDDPRFFEPFRPFFSARHGRPSIPMEWFLRLMFLRFRYKLGFEALCREVTDSLAWRRFCRIPLGVEVPHPSTLEKIVSRCGQAAIDALNEALLSKAAENKLIKTDRVRADTTVVEANVAYPTDSGLLAKGVARLSVLVGRVKDGGLAARTTFRDRTRSMRRRAHAIGAWLRRRNEDAKDEVYALTAEMANVAVRGGGRGHRCGQKRPADPGPAKGDGGELGVEAARGDRGVGRHHRDNRRSGPDSYLRPDTRRLHQGRVAARHRCPTDRQGTSG